MEGYQANGNKKNILIVEDDPEYLEVLRNDLEPEYEIRIIHYGAFSLEDIKQYQADLILFDLMEPVMEAFMTVQTIHNAETDRHIPVVFISAKSNKEVIVASMNSGVDAYFVKPIQKSELLKKIANIFDNQNHLNGQRVILLAGDDASYLKIMNTCLKDTFQVMIKNTVAEVKEYLQQQKPDVILLDYQPPVCSASEILNYIKELPEIQHIPVIMMTEIDDRKMAMKDAEGLSMQFLLKPISKMELLESIMSNV